VSYGTFRRHKYGAKKTTCDGVVFPSKMQAARYADLLLMERGNAISDLKREVRFTLQVPFEYRGKHVRAIEYVADFTYRDIATGFPVVEEVKGFETEGWKLKKKMFMFRYPGVVFLIVHSRNTQRAEDTI
jgi:hypothetical protein